MKHTPEPWYVYQRFNGYFEITNDDDVLIAELQLDENRNAFNDAYLLAAAPKLLAACEKLVNEAIGIIHLLDSDEEFTQRWVGWTNVACLQERINKAKAAIAKAKGDNETAN